jgi:hypothetical protein
MDYFSSIGYAPAVPMNPADFLLDLANGMFNHTNLYFNLYLKKLLEVYYIQEFYIFTLLVVMLCFYTS